MTSSYGNLVKMRISEEVKVKKSEPNIAVVVTSYNKPNFVEKCITSCLAVKEYITEIIIVDDNSDAATLTKLAKWENCKSFPISLIKNPVNRGTFESRKIGSESARSDYIIFLDIDDELLKEGIIKIHEHIEKHQTDIILSGTVIEQVRTRKQRMIRPPPKIINHDRLILNLHSLGIAGKTFKRRLLITTYQSLAEVKNKKLIYGEDALLFATAVGHALTVASVSGLSYKYNINQSSITENKDYNIVKQKILQLRYVIIVLKKLNTRENSILKGKLLSATKRLQVEKTLQYRHLPAEPGRDFTLKAAFKALIISRTFRDLARLGYLAFNHTVIRALRK